MKESKTMDTSKNARNTSLEYLILQVENVKIKNYITNHLIPQIEWYSRKGNEYKKQYYFYSTIVIFLGALIPVVSVFADGYVLVKVFLVALGSIVTACNTYITIHNFRDLWLTYRNMREKLLRVLYYYFYNAGIFAQSITQDEKDVLLVNICENEMSNENNEWMHFLQN